MSPSFWYSAAVIVSVATASAAVSRRHWRLAALGLLVAAWNGATAAIWDSHRATTASMGYEMAAVCAVCSTLFLPEVMDDEAPSWADRTARGVLGCLAIGLVVAGPVLGRAFTSPIGWLLAPGAWAPVLPMVTIVAVLWAGWALYRSERLVSVEAGVLMGVLVAVARDGWPFLTHQPFYVPATPLLLAVVGLLATIYSWIRTESEPTLDEKIEASKTEPESSVQRPTTSSRSDRFRVLIEYASDSILILDQKGTIHYQSPALRRMLGQHTRYVPGVAFQDFVHPDDKAPVAEVLQQVVVAEGRSLPVEFRMQRRLQEWSYMQGRATNLTGNKHIGGIVLNLKDISDSKRLETQLMQAQKMEAIGRLAGGVAHDFNNLLTAIQGYTDMLLRAVPSGSEEYEHLCQIQHAADRAAGLTQQLLAFSRQRPMQQQVLAINDVVSGTHDMLKRLIGEDVQLDLSLSPQAGNIMADATQIQQIIMNLAVNSRDAMPDGGRLSIETGQVAVDESQPWARAPQYALLTVRDSGAGMSREVLAHIFEPFFTTKGVGQGTGLGLSTVYGIVETGGGHVDVESAPGQGTTFRIYLPQVAAPTPAPSGRRSVPQKPPLLPSRRETLLLVEDDEVIRRLAERILKAKGFQVLVATNGEEAMQISEQHQGRIHLMVTDVVMPVMNGVELAKRLADSRPDTRVLFMSGYVPEASGGQGHMENTLPKPFTADSLVSKVQEVLRTA